VGIYECEYKTGVWELDYFAVHRDIRKKGVGTRLLEVAEEFAKKHGARYISIDSGPTSYMQEAFRFYEKHGYERVSFYENYYREGEARVDYYKKV
jgi:ribosomal protein S18 acetylase RimI-like enzyme